MAWRDSRASRRRLLLFSTSIVMGIAALVAIRSFARSAERAIDQQSRTLLGADLSITSRHAVTPDEEALFDSLGGEQAREIDFTSMLYFPNSRGTRLVSVRAISTNFPLYGRIEATPKDAAAGFRAGAGLLVDAALMHQFQARPGDAVRLGELTTTIAGAIRAAPGESVALATLSPRVYVLLEQVPQTGLLREGSMARYKAYFRFAEGTDVAKLVEDIRSELREKRLRFNTVETRKANLGRSTEDVYNYLNLAGFVALLLGGIGVASGVHVHVKHKLETVAVLRCLGCSVGQTFAIYVLQAALVGLIGGAVGAAMGVLLQHAVPYAIGGFLPLDIRITTDWLGVLAAVGQGLLISFLFGLLPLLDVRRISPLAAIRANYSAARGVRHDWAVWLIYALIGLGVVGFCLQHSRVWRHGLIIAGSFVAAFLVLGGMARLSVWLARRLRAGFLPYVWRQGLANLHRPQNRTVLLVLSLGLGTFLILSIYLIQHALVAELLSSRTEQRANLALFDVQADQKAGVMDILKSSNVPVLDTAPVITMRLSSIKGRTVEELLGDTNRAAPSWPLRREYRSTYGDRLRAGEKITLGEWPLRRSDGTAVPVSLEQGIARDLEVGLGDEIVFDVQGVPISTRVASLREVEWRRVQPNFFVVFPPGVLDDAPASHIIVARVDTPQQSGEVQRAVVEAFPNVSAIDLMLILKTLDTIFGRIAFAVQFMASFTIATGILVLLGAVLTGRYQRIRESVLLRSLGASRWQVFQVLLGEYLSVGVLAALVGTVLAAAAAWALTRFVFEVRFVLAIVPLLVAIVSVPVLTAVMGLLTSRGILSHPPLAVLRQE